MLSRSFNSSFIITLFPFVEKMASLIDIVVPHESPKKYHSMTARFREAFELIMDQNHSIRQASKKCKISRQRLKLQYSLFVESNIPLSEFCYVKKMGRKKKLTPQNQEVLRIAAHTLDSVGHPLSKVTMNDIIKKLHQNENNGVEEELSRSTLSRYRKEAKIPQRSVRNGISVRSKKSQVEYIDDFSIVYDEVLKQYFIRKELMYVLFLYIYLL
jgi:hypothetical protein